MLGILFHARRSTVSPLPAFQTEPTIGQPTNPKSSSKLVKKLKELRKVLRPSRLAKKNDDRSSHRSQKAHARSISDESWGNLAPGPFTAEDYEFRRTPPTLTHKDEDSSTHPIDVSSPAGAPTTIQATYSESHAPVNPCSAPLAATLKTLTNASAFHQQPVPAPLVEGETLAFGRRLAELRAAQPDIGHENPQVLRSRHPQAVVPASTPTIQRYNAEVARHQPAQGQDALTTKFHAKVDRQRTEKKSKWWEIGGDLRNHKRHFRREAIDYGNPNGDYCSANQLGDRGNSLKRGRANQRRQRPQKHASPKEVHESNEGLENQDIFSQANGEPAHPSTSMNPAKRSGQRSYPKSTGTTSAAESNHQLEWSFPRDFAAHRPISAVRQPLASLDPNLVVNEGAQPSLQADTPEHSDDIDSFSPENGVQAPTPAASLWFGQRIFFEGHNPGPSQL